MLRFACVLLSAVSASLVVAAAAGAAAGREFDLQGFVDRALRAGERKVVIPPGTYRVRPRNCQHLELKGLAYEVREYNGLLAAKAKRLSKAGKLPVLDYVPPGAKKSQRIQDSSLILEFLERRHPEPSLWPSDPRERALAHVLEDWADESLFWFEAYFRLCDPVAGDKAQPLLGAGRPAWEGWVVRKAGELTYKRKLAAVGLSNFDEDQLVTMIRGHFDAIEELVRGREWVVGDRQSIADIALAAQLGEFVRTSRFADELRGREALWSWLERNPG